MDRVEDSIINEMSNVLKYGMQIIIHVRFQSEQDPSQDVDGVFSSIGYQNQNVFMQTINLQKLKQLNYIKNVDDILFEIIPKLSYKYQQLCQQKKQQKIDRWKEEKEDRNSNDNDGAKLEKQIKKLEEKAEEEQDNNQKLIQASYDNTVKYGEQIMIRHLKTQQIMSYVIDENFEEPRLIVSRNIEQKMTFIIDPVLKIRQQGDSINLNEKLIFRTEKSSLYFYVNDKYPYFIDMFNFQNSNMKYEVTKKYIRQLDKSSQRNKIKLQNKQQQNSNIKIFKYRDYVKRENRNLYVYGGDVVRFYHQQLQSYLAANFNYNKDDDYPEVFLDKNIGIYKQEDFSVDQLFVLEHCQSGQGQLPNLNGQMVFQNQEIYLRHMISGKLLGLKRSLIYEGMHFVPIIIEDESKKRFQRDICSIQLSNQELCIKDISVRNNRNYLISTNDKDLTISQKTYYNSDKVFQGQEIDSYFSPLKDKEKERERKAIFFEQDVLNCNGLKIEKLDEKLLFQIQYIECYYQYLKYISDKLIMNQKIQSFKIEQKELIIGCLRKLIRFIYRESTTKSGNDVFEIQGKLDQTRQHLLKDIGIINILCEILYYPFKDGKMSIKDLDQVDPMIIQIFRLVYKFLMTMIQKYRPNELYCSQFIDLILEQSLKNQCKVDIFAESAFTELIDNNYMVISTKIRKKHINQMTFALTNKPSINIIKLIKALIICNKKVLFYYQNMITNVLLKNQKNRQKMVYQLVKDENDNVSMQTSDDRIDLVNYGPTDLDFTLCCKITNLFSKLCLQNNMQAVEELRNSYPFDICMIIITSDLYHIQLKNSIIKLFRVLWLESLLYFKKVQILQFVYSYNYILQFPSKNVCDTDIPISMLEYFDQINNFIHRRLSQSFSYQFPDNHKDKKIEVKFQHQILLMVKTLLSYGYYQFESQLNKILSIMLDILNRSGSVQSIVKKENRYNRRFSQHTFDNKMLFRGFSIQEDSQEKEIKACKSKYQKNDQNRHLIKNIVLVCEIVDFILDFQLNYKIIMSLKNLQSFYMKISQPVQKHQKKEEQSEGNMVMRRQKTKKKTSSLMKAMKEQINLNKSLSLQKRLVEILEEQKQNIVISLDHEKLEKLVCILIELSFYQSNKLKFRSFQLLSRLQSTHRQFIEKIKDVLVIRNQKQIQYQKVKQDIAIIEHYIIKADISRYDEGHITQNMLKEIQKILIRHINQFFQDEKPNNESGNLQQEVNQYNNIQNFFDLKIDHTYQSILRISNIYKTIMELFLKFQDRQNYKKNQEEIDTIINLIIQFFTLFVYKNNKNKESINHISHYLVDFIIQENMVQNSHFIQFFYKDNRILLKDKNMVKKIQIFLLDNLNVVTNQVSFQVQLLVCLKNLIQIEQTIIKNNKIQMFNLLFLKKYQKIAKLLTQKDALDKFYNTNNQVFQLYLFQINKKVNQVITVPYQLDYFIYMLQLFTLDKPKKSNSFQQRIQSFIQIKQELQRNGRDICRYIKRFNKILYIKKYIYYFYYKMYLCYEINLEKLDCYMQQYILEECIQDFIYIIDQIKQSNQDQEHKSSFGNEPIQVFYMKTLLVLINCLTIIIGQQFFDLQLGRSYESIYEMICIQLFDEVFYDEVIKIVKQNDLESNEEFNFQEDVESLIQAIYKNCFYMQEKFKNDEFKYNEQLSQDNDENIEKFRDIIMNVQANIEENENVQDIIQEQTMQLKTIYINIESLSQKRLGDCNKLDLEQVCLNLQNILNYISGKEVEDSYKNQIIDLFQFFLFKQTNLQNKVLLSYGKQFQQVLCEIGTISYIVKSFISDQEKLKFKFKLVDLCLMILEEKNETYQNQFYKEIMKKKNSEFSIKIDEIIKYNYSKIKKQVRVYNLYQLDQIRQHKNYLRHLKIFQFLEILCSNKNEKKFKDQLSNINQTFQRIDFINNSCVQIQKLSYNYNLDSLEIINQILKFLIQVISGQSFENQMKIVDQKIIIQVMEILTQIQQRKNQLYYEKIENKILYQIVRLINIILESNNQLIIYEQLINQIDLNYLLNIITSQFKSFIKRINISDSQINNKNIIQKTQIKCFDSETMIGLDIFKLIDQLSKVDFSQKQTVLDNPIQTFLLNQKLKTDEQNAIKFFQQNIVNIEIYQNQELFRIYFPLQPICRKLSKEKKKKILSKLDRSNRVKKIIDFMEQYPDIYEYIHHISNLEQQAIKISNKQKSFFNGITGFITVTINMILLQSLKRGVKNNTTYILEISHGWKKMIILLGILNILNILILIILRTILELPLKIKQFWRRYCSENAILKDPAIEIRILNKTYDQLNLKESLYVFKIYGPYSKYFLKNGKQDLKFVYIKFLYFMNFLILLLKQYRFYIFQLTIATVALSEQQYLLYCIQLLELFQKFSYIKDTFGAIYKHRIQFFTTLLLNLLIIYLFSVIGFWFLNDLFIDENMDSSNNNNCDSQFRCYIIFIYHGLRKGYIGGIGAIMAQLTVQEFQESKRYLRYIYIMLFWMIVNIFGQNMIFSIIINSLKQMREDRKNIENDMNSKCFICDISRLEFDSYGDGFIKHIKQQHNLWNYIYFIFYLKNKDESELSIQEQRIFQQIKTDDYSWIPLNRAMILDFHQSQNFDIIFQKQMHDIQSKQDDIKDKIVSMKQNISETYKSI